MVTIASVRILKIWYGIDTIQLPIANAVEPMPLDERMLTNREGWR